MIIYSEIHYHIILFKTQYKFIISVLKESKQIELAVIIPEGTNVTREQIKLREKIFVQRQLLDELNEKSLNNQSNDHSSFKWDQEIIQFIEDLGVNRYGFSSLLKEFTYENNRINPIEKVAIVLVVPMNYERMQSVPSIESATEIHRIYHKTGEFVLKLTRFLREKGIQATGHHPLGNINDYHQILMPPHAMYAGLGEKGRTGLFIDHKYGPIVRLGIVTTSLKLNCGSPKDRGINAFCHRCRYCVPHCPPRALPPDKYLESLRDNKPIKFTIDGDKCIKYFAKYFGCGKCIVKCVLTQPNEFEFEKRLKRIEIWYHKWVKSGELLEMQTQQLTS
ncbi:MAG: 3-chloro-4-hydroxyphenylacetate reductive dehalogenase precursor [Candidatus Heimdallarchaeota archaeon LC_2]|nr:MAG: 3-chloro-4-hydroxyphenylacetate reductive dehalogenase precursor [Candidatus Heimdallarchaeota archaeon LC_2]